MQHRLVASLALFLLAFPLGAVLARDPFVIEHADAPSMADPANAQTIIDELKDIPQYLSDSQCGGWDFNQSVEGKIARITGVPGRPHVWNGALLTGMGVREDVDGNGNIDDDFQYPDGTRGLSTRCNGEGGLVPRTVWELTGNPDRPDEVEQREHGYANPQYDDPSCRWRVDGKEDPEGNPPLPLVPDEELHYAEMQQPENDRQSPVTCTNFCTYLNAFQYRDCREPFQADIMDVDDDGNPIKIGEYTACPPDMWQMRYLCTGAWVEPDDLEQNFCDIEQAENTERQPNSKFCRGPWCRCGREGGEGCAVQQPQNPEQLPGSLVHFVSYFRKYLATFERGPVTKSGPEDQILPDASVGCYGDYREFDPRTHRTEQRDRRCTINVDVVTMRESQVGKGKIGSEGQVQDIDPIAAPRTKSPNAQDIWDLRPGWAMSLIKQEVKDPDGQNLFRTLYHGDIGEVVLDESSADRSRLTIQYPVDRIEAGVRTQGEAQTASLRAFDETGDRIVVRWWQKQQTEVALLTKFPIVRILLPNRSPLAREWGVTENTPPPTAISPGADRSASIEVQVAMDTDLLTLALERIERALLLPLEEEQVSILVPVASPIELRAIAEEWCSWVREKNKASTCDNAPAEVKDLMAKLRSYADRLEEIRALRGELSLTLAKVVQVQRDLTAPIATWIRENIDRYRTAIERQRGVSMRIVTAWRAITAAMQVFHDRTNLPWCMNQRFTAPILSLLDPWLPSRVLLWQEGGVGNGKISAEGLPNLTIPRQRDSVIDFSRIAVYSGTGSIRVPVLNPMQVRLNFPHPVWGQPDARIGAPLPDFPSLAPIHQLLEDIRTNLAQIAPPPALPPPYDFGGIDGGIADAAVNRMADFRLTLTSMQRAYREFWTSLSPLRPEDENDDPENIPHMKRNLQCKAWGISPCVHTEMDLLERLERIGSRPQITLREDVLSASPPRSASDVCIPENHACVLLHGETGLPAYRWELNVGSALGNGEAIDLLRRAVRSATLPTPVGSVPPGKVLPFEIGIPHTLPSLAPVRPIDLSPPRTL